MTTQTRPKRIVVAVSGSGRSLENLIADAASDNLYHIVGVVSSSSSCRGYDIAKKHGMTVFCDPFKVPFNNVLTATFKAWLGSCHPDYIALAGFLRPFPLFSEYDGRVINIHPALLPDFGGKGMYGHHVHAAVLKCGVTTTGASVHFVNERYDEGRVIAQVRVPVKPGDTVEALASRVFEGEKKLYPLTLRGLINGRLPLGNNQVKIYDEGM